MEVRKLGFMILSVRWLQYFVHLPFYSENNRTRCAAHLLDVIESRMYARLPSRRSLWNKREGNLAGKAMKMDDCKSLYNPS